MKSIVLKCYICKKRAGFVGEDIKEILEKIDNSGWHDEPRLQNADQCPECWNNIETD